MPELLTLDDVAKILRTSKAWVRDHCTRRHPLIPVVRLGGRKVKRWYGHYYLYVKDTTGNEVRQHRGINLGEKAKLRKWEAEERLRDEIAKTTNGAPLGDGRTLAWFAREKFLPMKMKSWAPSTRETNVYIIERHIIPALGQKPLAELDKFDAQIFLNTVA